MSKVKNYLYIYLARLNKKGIKVISGFRYDQKVYPTRVLDINELHMDKQTTQKVQEEFYKNKMEYELWIETASSFNDLKESLSKRGYGNLPLQQFSSYSKPTTLNEKQLVTQKSTMTRRNSDIKR